MASSALLEEIKPWLSSHVVATLGLYRNDVADISIQCLSADLKRKDAIGKAMKLWTVFVQLGFCSAYHSCLCYVVIHCTNFNRLHLIFAQTESPGAGWDELCDCQECIRELSCSYS